jgi:hypothetical protein
MNRLDEKLRQAMVDFLSSEWGDDRLDLYPHPRDESHSDRHIMLLVDQNYRGGIRLFMLDYLWEGILSE